MNGYRWLAGFLGAGMVTIAGCSPDVAPPDPGYHLSDREGRGQVDPVPFMAAIGCVRQMGRDSSGSVAIRLIGQNTMAHFRCAGASPNSLRKAVAAYRRAARRHAGGAAVQEADGGDGNGEVWVVVQYQCDLNTTVVNYGDGTYDIFQWVDNCQYWYRILDGGGTGMPLPPPPLPPPCVAPVDGPDKGELTVVSAAELQAEDEALDQLMQQDPSLTVCKGASARSCMTSSPGVYIGSWPIPVTGGFARHSAVLTTTGPTASPPIQVTELQGWTEHITNYIAPRQPDAAYGGGVAAYTWVKVADVNSIGAVNSAIDAATSQYQGLPYSGGSNRFVSMVMLRANLPLTDNEHHALGSNPGICWCGNCQN